MSEPPTIDYAYEDHQYGYGAAYRDEYSKDVKGEKPAESGGELPLRRRQELDPNAISPGRRSAGTSTVGTSNSSWTTASSTLRRTKRVLSFDPEVEAAETKASMPKRYQWRCPVYEIEWEDVEAWLQARWPNEVFVPMRNGDWYVFDAPETQTRDSLRALSRLRRERRRNRERSVSSER